MREKGGAMKSSVLLSALSVLLLWAAPAGAQNGDEPVEVRVDGLDPSPYGVSVTLRAFKTDEELHVMIGLSEGQAIARALGRQKPPRPMTHDLMKSLLDATGWQVQRVIIRDLVQESSGATFLADVVLEKNGTTQVIDARPSDAMALAVRTNAKIYVNPLVFVLERQQLEKEELEEGGPSEDILHL
jgi:bifunctional DNase/RNase